MILKLSAVNIIYIQWIVILGMLSIQNSGVLSFQVPTTCSAKKHLSASTIPAMVGGQNKDIDTTTTKTEDDHLSSLAIANAASKFKIVTCMSTSCCRRRKNLGLDSLATFSDLYSLSCQANAASSTGTAEPFIVVEEGSCLGVCKKAPCVAIEHEDFVGYVALEGMTNREFMDRVFQNVITTEDAERIWSCVTEAVKVMAQEEEDMDE